ncbi:hypothetical protein HOY80DRAFT_1054403 [Tuber brumale]|nr:hypothetical protein HOY80DRAFT_1054403 [Tuber brumale]
MSDQWGPDCPASATPSHSEASAEVRGLSQIVSSGSPPQSVSVANFDNRNTAETSQKFYYSGIFVTNSPLLAGPGSQRTRTAVRDPYPHSSLGILYRKHCHQWKYNDNTPGGPQILACIGATVGRPSGEEISKRLSLSSASDISAPACLFSPLMERLPHEVTMPWCMKGEGYPSRASKTTQELSQVKYNEASFIMAPHKMLIGVR